MGDINDYTYWDSTGPHDGVRLDTDCTTGYGPECITFTAGTLVGTYRVAVHVYTYKGNPKCTGMNQCQLVGGETVALFESRGSVKISTMDPVRLGAHGGWQGWCRCRGRASSFDQYETTKTTCSALMKGDAGDCRGACCRNGCNSNCGDCTKAI